MSLRPSPRQRILDFVSHALTSVTRSMVAEYLGISYWAARYYLEKLAAEGFIQKQYVYTDTMRRVFYSPVPVKAKLYRVKIRLYNDVMSVETPTGQFQGWFDVDAPLAAGGFPNLEHWLTEKEIRVAKAEMVERFNNPLAWRTVQGTLTAYLTDEKGIPYAGTPATAPKYPKEQIPPDEYKYGITVSQLVTGISNITPVPVETIDKEHLGVLIQRLMVIKENEINYDSRYIGDWVYRLSPEEIERIRSEVT